MASLLIGSAVFGFSKIRDKQRAKKAKKQAAYEERYSQLQDEHEKSPFTTSPTSTTTFPDAQASTTSQSMGDRGVNGGNRNANPFLDEKRVSGEEERRSEEFGRDGGRGDGPAEWVEQHYQVHGQGQTQAPEIKFG